MAAILSRGRWVKVPMAWFSISLTFWSACGLVSTCSFHPWWRHQMETFSALLAICAGNSPVTGERPVTRSFGVSFDLRLHKRLSKQSRGWWFETPSRPLWRHCNVTTGLAVVRVRSPISWLFCGFVTCFLDGNSQMALVFELSFLVF